jgi:hypothetical protein
LCSALHKKEIWRKSMTISVERLAIKYRACGGVYEAVQAPFGFVLALFEDEPAVARQFWDANIKDLQGDLLQEFLAALADRPMFEPRLGVSFPFARNVAQEPSGS